MKKFFSRIKSPSQRIYILPTRHGLIFGFVILVSYFYGSFSDGNQNFILASAMLFLALVSMLMTQDNLNSLKIEMPDKLYLQEYENGDVSLIIFNASENIKSQVSIRIAVSGKVFKSLCLDIPGFAKRCFRCSLCLPRGIYKLETVKVTTRAPLGFFRSWFSTKAYKDLIIYPKPVGRSYTYQKNSLLENSHDGELSGFRSFQHGDKYSQVYWKGVARGLPLQVRTHEQSKNMNRSLNWLQTSHLSSQQERLNQMSFWIHEAHHEGVLYSLTLPNIYLDLSNGEEHYYSCLKALAEVNLA